MRDVAVVVKEMTYEADAVVSLRLTRADGLALPAWQPGAHIDLVLPTGLVRQYSLVDSAVDLSWYRIAVLRDPMSRGGSEYVHLFLRPGQTVAIREPLNHFALGDAQEYLFIAGGIGITPIIPMIDQATRRERSWTLHYGGRSLPSMAFRERLAAASGQVVLWPADQCGLLPLSDIVATPRPATMLYCCGPAGLLEAVLDIAAVKGWASDAVRIERFKPRARPDSRRNRAIHVVAARTGTEVDVAPAQTVLDALARAGVRIESSCRDGVCGTCQVRVLGGEPDHRDDVLTLAQKSANDVMMICVSRSRSDELILDV